MAKTIKRVLNEILVRYDLAGNIQGAHARYANYVTADDGVTPSGLPVVEDATPADWNDPELKQYFDNGVLGLHTTIQSKDMALGDAQCLNDGLSDTLVRLTQERDEHRQAAADYFSKMESAVAELEAAKRRIADLEAQAFKHNSAATATPSRSADYDV